MALPNPPSNPNQPIPNGPFYSLSTYSVVNPQGSFVVGSGLFVSLDGVLSSTGGGGGAVNQVTGGPGINVSPTTGNVVVTNTGVRSIVAGSGIAISGGTGNVTISLSAPFPTGTVTSVGTGAGLTGGPITGSGIISLTSSGVTPGTYANATVTVDAYGRVTNATVSPVINTVSGTLPVVVSLGTNPIISVNPASTSAAGVVELTDSVSTTSSTLAATATAVKSAFDVASAAIPKACLIGAGALVTATAGSTPVALPVGTVGQVLTVCPACIATGGLTWAAGGGGGSGTVTSITAGSGLTGGTINTSGTIALDPTSVIAPSLLAAKGSIVTATAASTPAQLGAGTDGQYLVACAACTTGLSWQNLPPAGTVTQVNTGTGLSGGPFTTSGTVSLNVATTGALGGVIPDGTNITVDGLGSINLGTTAVTPGAYTYASLTVDANGRLTAASSGAAPVVESAFTAVGDLLAGTGVGSYTALGVGANGCVLAANSACAAGLEWISASGAADATPAIAGIVFGCTIPLGSCVGTTALGCKAGLSITTGIENTLIGLDSGCTITSGSGNAALGASSLLLNNTGDRNVAAGAGSLLSNNSGCFNTALGALSACNITSGSNNVAIGYCVQVANPTADCQLAIGPNNGSYWLTGDSSLNIQPGAGIKDCTGSTGLAGQVLSTTGTAIQWIGGAGTGTVTCVATGVGLSGGPITGSGTIDLIPATSLALGGVIPDGTSITVNASGVISAAVAAAIPCSTITGKGVIVTGTSTGIPAALSLGLDGQILSVCASCPEGITWIVGGTVSSITAGTGLNGGNITSAGTISIANTGVGAGTYTYPTITVNSQGQVTGANSGTTPVLPADFTGKGALLVGTGVGAFASQTVGTDGQFLMACSTCTNGVTWTSSSVAPATPTVNGVVLGCTVATNTALGCNSLLAVPTGTNNVAIGRNAGCAITTGGCNTVVGASSFMGGATTCFNTVVGSCSGISFTTNGNTAIGACTMWGSTIFGAGNTSVGYQTMLNLRGGGFNVAVGQQALNCIVDGGSNTAVGFCTLSKIDNSGSGTAIGSRALASATTVSQDVAIGVNTMFGAITTGFNVAVGSQALGGATNPVGNTVIGFQAGNNSSFGNNNTVIGCGAAVFAADQNAVVGVNAMRFNSTGCNNAILGYQAGGTFDTCFITSVGANSFPILQTSAYNVGIGYNVGPNQDTGNCNVAIGPLVDLPNLTGSCQLAIGYGTTCWLTGCSNGNIQPGAGILDCAASAGTAGQVLMSNGANAICWGSAGGGSPATPTAQGTVYGCTAGNTAAVGQNALASITSNVTSNTAFGFDAGCSITSGSGNVAIGLSALCSVTVSNSNIAIGATAMGAATGDSDIGIGNGALFNSSGLCNIAIGVNGASGITSGCHNVAIGTNSASTLTTECFNVVIGSCIDVPSAADQQLAIGANGTYWLTGCSNGDIRPGAGIIDSTASSGSANQVLVSTGSNAVQWKSVNSALAAPNYGSFFDTTTQVNTVGTGTGRAVALNSTDSATNFSVVGGSEITAVEAGTYNLQFSLQFETTTASLQTIEVWLVKEGTAVPYSNTRFTTKGAGEAYFAALNYIVELAAGENVQLFWASGDANMTLVTDTSAYLGPDIPSAIVTIVPVGA